MFSFVRPAASLSEDYLRPGFEMHPSSQARGESAAAVTAMKPSFFLKSLWVVVFFATLCSAEVLRVTINDAIQPVTAEYIARALEVAAANHNQAVLIEINTPGGLVTSAREIIEKIEASPVPVIVYVTPTGSRAGSAGIFILEAADVAAMAPGTNAGAAHPVLLFGPVAAKPDDEMNRKIENDSDALMRSIVAKRGRNIALAGSAVRESNSFRD